MGNRGYLSNFECGMVVVGVNIAETADLLGSSYTTISRVVRFWSEKLENIQCATVFWVKMLCMVPEVRGEVAELIGRRQ